MTQQHLITPPPELVEQWKRSGPADAAVNNAYERHIATCAAQWGADQELEACCRQLTDLEWYDEIKNLRGPFRAAELRAARRPKPPSLKEQAMEDLDSLIADLANHGMGFKATNIRRALEQLPDNE